MEDRLTRRKFIKDTMSAGSALVVFPGFQSGCMLPANCDNCSINGKELLSSPSFPLLKKQFCPNCGIELSTNTFPVASSCACSTAATGETAKPEQRNHPSCCQVPFPGPALAGGTDKPVFSVAELTF